MKSNQLSTHNLLSQSGATSLNATSSMDLGHGVSFTLGGSLSVSDHPATTYKLGGINMMTFTLEEHIADKYGGYMTIGIKQCAVCTVPFPDICDEDPGSVEAAVGVVFVCEHPECREIAGSAVLICGTDIQELLEKDHNDIFALARENNGVLECDGFDVDLMAIVDRRVTVGDYLQGLGWLQEWGGAWDRDPYAQDEDDWDSDNEKWSNYWGDYNQCGVHVSY